MILETLPTATQLFKQCWSIGQHFVCKTFSFQKKCGPFHRRCRRKPGKSPPVWKGDISLECSTLKTLDCHCQTIYQGCWNQKSIMFQLFRCLRGVVKKWSLFTFGQKGGMGSRPIQKILIRKYLDFFTEELTIGDRGNYFEYERLSFCGRPRQIYESNNSSETKRFWYLWKPRTQCK